jgi:hypothetical protein
VLRRETAVVSWLSIAGARPRALRDGLPELELFADKIEKRAVEATLDPFSS